jgi:hypothetical protein
MRPRFQKIIGRLAVSMQGNLDLQPQGAIALAARYSETV